MITNPEDTGIYNPQIDKYVEVLHDAGALAFTDQANANGILGIARARDAGFDACHFNLHKTFSTPHGGGGPGAGMIAANEALAPYLPGPVAVKRGESYRLEMPAKSIGQVKAFYGNFGVLVRAYTYLLMTGGNGLRRVAENAVLNANYLKALVEGVYPVPYKRHCMHEFVAKGTIVPGVHTLDIAKRLIDYGFHPPTIYFPLIVQEALMIEPTETESKETLDQYADAMLKIAKEAAEQPELLHDAPHNAPVARLDEVMAARCPILCYRG